MFYQIVVPKKYEQDLKYGTIIKTFVLTVKTTISNWGNLVENGSVPLIRSRFFVRSTDTKHLV